MKKFNYTIFIIVIGVLLPIFVYFVSNYSQTNVVDFWAFMSDFSPFNFVEQFFNQVTDLVFGEPFKFNSYLSYICGVEIFTFFVDFILLLPRMFRNFIIRGTKNEK